MIKDIIQEKNVCINMMSKDAVTCKCEISSVSYVLYGSYNANTLFPLRCPPYSSKIHEKLYMHG
jgi:hypothetical protein